MTDTPSRRYERAERISRQLRGEQEAHKNDNLLTFQTNISAMAMDSANCIDDPALHHRPPDRRERGTVAKNATIGTAERR